MKNRTMWVADAIIGILTATSTVWVNVTVWHRLIIGVTIAFAMQTLLTWIDSRQQDTWEDNASCLEDMVDRKAQNRRNTIRTWLSDGNTI